MEYSLDIKDFIKIIKHAWKQILLVTIIVTVVVALIPVLASSRGMDPNEDEISRNEQEIELYENWSEAREEAIESTSEELAAAYENLNKSPWMGISAYDCTFNRIAITFADENELSSMLVDAWVTEEFGGSSAEAPRYLTLVTGDKDGIVITIYETGEYDLDSAAQEIKNSILKRAEENQISITSISSMKYQGFNQDLFDKQDKLRANVVNVQSALSYYNTGNVMTEPARLIDEGEGLGLRTLLKFIILGGMAGLCAGIILMVYRAVKKRLLLSSRQVKEMYGLEELGAYDGTNPGKTKLLSATIKALAEPDAEVLVYNDADPVKCESLITDLNEAGDNKFACASGLSQDAESAENLLALDTVAMTIKLGTTTGKDLEQSVAWAHRFKKDIIGYILLED